MDVFITSEPYSELSEPMSIQRKSRESCAKKVPGSESTGRSISVIANTVKAPQTFINVRLTFHASFNCMQQRMLQLKQVPTVVVPTLGSPWKALLQVPH